MTETAFVAGQRRRSRKSSIALHATLIGATLIAVFPVLWLISSSFKLRQDIITPHLHLLPQHWTLSSYRHVLGDNDRMFLTWFANSLVIAILTTILGLILATTAGYAFSRYRFPGHRPALMAFLVVQMFPGVILLYPLYKLVLDLPVVHVSLLDSFWGTKTALVLAYASTAVPFCVWMLKGYFDTIPYELEEAARIDGLSPFGTFLRVVLPLSLPGLAVTAFFAFITAWNELMFAFAFLSDDRTYTLPVGMQTYVNQFVKNWDYLCASAVLVTIPSLLVFLWAQRYLVGGLTTGGVKG
jgi:arabinogalactan oligomer / maltooligosaccharide transport system permease protein